MSADLPYLSSDSLFHVFLRLDVASTFSVRQVCHLWRSVLAKAWTFRVLDSEALVSAFGQTGALKRFALFSRSGEARPTRLKLSPNLPPAQVFAFLKLSTWENLREIDLQGVKISNSDLCMIPSTVYCKLRKLIVAPEDTMISILSLSPIVQCTELRFLRWEGIY